MSRCTSQRGSGDGRGGRDGSQFRWSRCRYATRKLRFTSQSREQSANIQW
ncbi:hypothetical protein [Microcoleus sp. B7-D4]